MISASFPLGAQAPPRPSGAQGAGTAAGRGPGRGGPAPAYPTRPPADPAVLARGKALYGVNCNFCHGSDARGGEGGPNLIRSDLVMNDKSGELITPVVRNGRPDRGMPKLDLTSAQVADIAVFIHSFPVGGRDESRMLPPNILVGEAKAGEAYFESKCGSCHSASGDLKGLATRFADPKALQQIWLAPGGGGGRGGAAMASARVPPVTVTVTLPSGQRVSGRLGRMDDFIVSLTEADGTPRSFRRDGDTPKVEIHDPLAPHRELLPTYTDKDIHNVTAYLVTLK